MALTEQQRQQILGQLRGGGTTTTPTSRFNAAQIKQITTDDDSKRLLSLKNLDTSLKAYKDLVSSADQFKFLGTGKIDSAYADLKIKYKEAANLGALTGPDVTLLEEAIKPIAGGVGKAIKFKLGGGVPGALAGIDQIQSTAQQDKDRLGTLIATKYGREDPYLKFMLEGTKAGQPNPLEAAGISMSPQLQQLIAEKKQKLISEGKLQPETGETLQVPEQPQEEKKPLTERLLGVSRTLQKVASLGLGSGRTGETIGEAIGTKIAMARARPEDRQFISPGPTKGAVAKDILGAGLEVGGAGLVGKLAGKAIKLAQPLRQAFTKSKRLQGALDIIKTPLSVGEREAAIASGRLKTTKGFLSTKYEIPPSNQDLEIAKEISGIVKKGWKPEQNIKVLKTNASKLNSQIKEDLATIPSPTYNQNTVKNYLNTLKNSDETQFVVSGDKQAKAIYDSVIDSFVKQIKTFNNKGVFEARQNFDRIAEKEIKNLFGEQFGSVRKQAVRDVRRGANEFVLKNLPKGSKVAEFLNREHKILSAVDDIAANVARGGAKGTIVKVPTRLGKGVKKYAAPAIIGGVVYSGASKLVKGDNND